MAFSLMVEMLNIRLRRKMTPVHLHQIYDGMVKDAENKPDNRS
jgi:hypothetical protein